MWLHSVSNKHKESHSTMILIGTAILVWGGPKEGLPIKRPNLKYLKKTFSCMINVLVIYLPYSFSLLNNGKTVLRQI